MTARPGPVLAAQVNGRDATVDDLAPLAFAGYAHYTSMQVRSRRVRGLSWHLERLDAATGAMFGARLDGHRVRAAIAGALDAARVDDASVVVTVFAADAATVLAGHVVQPDLLVRASAAVAPARDPIAVATARFTRVMPDIKHADTLGLTWHPRLAAAAGYDDVLFVDDRGEVSEGSVWNVCFRRAGVVVLPSAPSLPGIARASLLAGLERLGVRPLVEAVDVASLASFDGAALVSSVHDGRPIDRIDGVRYTSSGALAALVARAIGTQPWEPVEPLSS